MIVFDRVEVWTSLGAEGVLAGTLYLQQRRGGNAAVFAYAAEYLGLPGAYNIDPAFRFGSGRQVHPRGALAGAFSDSQPDRWGRRLVDRNHESLGLRAPSASDYLLGVDDRLRMGALRFRAPGGEFLANLPEREVPPIVNLAELQRMSERYEAGERSPELAQLVRAGSSLGGARPKASVIGRDGRLKIAKLASVADDYDVIAWEAVALDLAEQAGIEVPARELLRVGDKSVLVLDRFDRLEAEQRVPYISAMTLLEAVDGESASYAEIADSLESVRDRHELFRRAVFGLLIGNTDDHLRNHGLLLRRRGWSLSPAFDLNPSLDSAYHQTTVMPGESDSVRRAVEAAPYFDLSQEEAMRTLEEAVRATSEWREAATRRGIGAASQRLMARVLDGRHASEAKQLMGDN